MKIKKFVSFFGIWIGAALIFWFWEGSTLKYDVYSADTYRYSENFSTTGRLIISSLIGLIASAGFLIIRYLFNYVSKRVDLTGCGKTNK